MEEGIRIETIMEDVTDLSLIAALKIVYAEALKELVGKV